MQQRWPVLAQIIIALGFGGGLISAWAGFSHQNWMVAAFGLLSAFLFWSFYQFKPWAHRAVIFLLGGLLISDILTAVSGLVDALSASLVIAFRALILVYFNTPRIKAFFEQEAVDRSEA